MKKIIIISAIIVVIGVGFGIWWSITPHNGEEQLKKAIHTEKQFHENESTMLPGEIEKEIEYVVKEYSKVYKNWPKSEVADDSFIKACDFYKVIADKHINNGDKEQAKKIYTKIISTYDELEKHFPKSNLIKDTYLEKINIYRNIMDDLDKTIITMREYLDKFPKEKNVSSIEYEICNIISHCGRNQIEITIPPKGKKIPSWMDAITAYQNFIDKYSTHKDPLVASAKYKLAEINQFDILEIDTALDLYSDIINNHPKSPEAPKAYLRRIEIFNDREDYEQALKEADELLKKYPNSQEAATARNMKNQLAEKTKKAEEHQKEVAEKQSQRYSGGGSGGQPYDIMIPDGPDRAKIFKDIIESGVDTTFIKIDLNLNTENREFKINAELDLVLPSDEKLKEKAKLAKNSKNENKTENDNPDDKNNESAAEINDVTQALPLQVAEIYFGLENFVKINSIDLYHNNKLIKSNREIKDLIIKVIPETPLPAGSNVKVVFNYEGTFPEKDVRYMIKKNLGYLLADGPWYPWTIMGDIFKAEINVNLPEDVEPFAAGNLIKEKKINKRIIRNWETQIPIAGIYVNYGQFDKVEDKYNNLPLGFYWYKGKTNFNKNTAQKYLDELKNILSFYEQNFGQFRFQKLYLIETELPENIGGIGTPTMLFLSEKIDDKLAVPINILAHEASHQWWGNTITLSLFPQYSAWFSEGFATYSDLMFTEHTKSMEQMIKDMSEFDKIYLNMPFEDRPIAETSNHHPNYPTIVYMKGAHVLHSLRWIVGDKAFFEILKSFVQKKAFIEHVSLKDFQNLCNIVQPNNKDIDVFFNEWLFDKGILSFQILDVNVIEENGVIHTSYTLEQLGSLVSNLPIEIKYTSADNKEQYSRIQLNGTTTAIKEVTNFKPVKIEIDPNSWFLKVLGNNNVWESPNNKSDTTQSSIIFESALR